MDTIIDQIIAHKPHLTDPLRYYGKVKRFTESVRKVVVPLQPNQIAYSPELAVRILDSLSTMLDLPEGTLSPLKQAFELREIDFTRLPLRGSPCFFPALCRGRFDHAPFPREQTLLSGFARGPRL